MSWSGSRSASTMGPFKYKYKVVQQEIDEEDIQFIQDAEVCPYLSLNKNHGHRGRDQESK